MPGLVQTSLNLGIMYTDEDRQVLRASIRSSVATQKKAVLDQLICLTEQLGGTTEAEGDYPGWEYMPQSPLRERMVEVYQEQYGKEPTIKAMHAGVECGLFSEKLPGAGLRFLRSGPVRYPYAQRADAHCLRPADLGAGEGSSQAQQVSLKAQQALGKFCRGLAFLVPLWYHI